MTTEKMEEHAKDLGVLLAAKINDYTKDLSILLALNSLIASHKRLSVENLAYEKANQENWQEARKLGYESGRAQNNAETISLEKLRTMTLQELLNLLQ